MSSPVERHSKAAEQVVRAVRRAMRRQFSAEEKVRIAGLRGEDSIAELCRRKGLNQNLYYRWSKDFLEADKKRLTGARSDQQRDQGDPGKHGSSRSCRLKSCWKTASSKKAYWPMGVRYLRYSVAEKLEIIRLVERSSLSVRRTMAQLAIPVPFSTLVRTVI